VCVCAGVCYKTRSYNSTVILIHEIYMAYIRHIVVMKLIIMLMMLLTVIIIIIIIILIMHSLFSTILSVPTTRLYSFGDNGGLDLNLRSGILGLEVMNINKTYQRYTIPGGVWTHIALLVINVLLLLLLLLFIYIY